MLKALPKLIASRSTFLLLILLTFASCAKNENDNAAPSNGGSASTGPPTLGFSYIYFDVQGPAVSINDSITLSDASASDTWIFGGLLEDQTPEGPQEVVNLIFTRLFAGGEVNEVQMYIPAEAGSNALGPFETTSTGNISGSSTFNMTVEIRNAFYDNNGDGDNDLISSVLLSTENTVVTVTDYETYNAAGVVAVDFIKGSISGTMEMLVYVDGTTEPAVLTHTITGTFEYHRP